MKKPRSAGDLYVRQHMARLLSNIATYKAIAVEANAEAQRLWSEARTPKPDGSEGFILTFDPSRRSFKQSLVAIAFSAIHFEALLYLIGIQVMGNKWKNHMDGKSYEDKLIALGVTEEALLEGAKRLRKSRKDLVHEKAVSVEKLSNVDIRWAHEEAAFAVQFVSQAAERLQSVA